MKINNIPVQQYITPSHVTSTGYAPSKNTVDDIHTKLEIGILPGNGNTFARVPLMVPVNAIMQNGRWPNRRMVRFNHFMNVIRSLAVAEYGVKENEQVVFLGFTGELYDGEKFTPLTVHNRNATFTGV